MAIKALEPEFGLSLMLKVAGMARSSYYYHLQGLNRKSKYDDIVRRLKYLHKLHKERYGYRRLTAALHNEGIVINHKTVRKLMREHGLECRIRRKRKTGLSALGPGLAASPNILNRDFHADAPFEKGVTDVTEFDVGSDRVYVSAILDLYDGAVISIVYSLKNNTDLIMSMYEQVPDDHKNYLDNMLIHTDQGILYRSVRYKEFIDSHSITQSMSRRGNCYDNAVVESFFGTFKAETIRLYRINTLEQLAEELKDYARYYNRERLKSTLGYKSPFDYRKDNGFEKFI